jgi:phospholipid/cholesterol/gamma-HCH transport system substrate-binding protein
MKRAIQKHLRDVIAILAIATVGVLVGGYILANQRFYAPSWVPIVGSDFVDYEAEFSTAQAVTPGQGQSVQVAGVTIGEIGEVRLRGGRAVVTMKIKKRYSPIYRDATALLRPKTGLQDMTIELDPGNRAAGAIPEGGTLPVSQTLPNVNPDEILAGLDADTRSYLQLLVSGAGQGLRGNASDLSATLKRFDPTSRYLARIGNALEKRQAYIKRSITNFRLLSEALGEKDTQLARFVRSSDEVFQAFANQDQNLRASLRLLPGALASTNDALGKSATLSEELGPTLGELRPTARGLAPAQQALQAFARETTPVVKNQLRPFTKTAAPTVSALRPAAADLAATTPELTTSLEVLNQLTASLAYNPPGKEEGYLYWLAWANHATASMFGSQDAHGPTRRGIVFANCSALLTLERIGQANPVLGTLSALLNPPSTEEVCPQASGAARAARKRSDAAVKRAAAQAGTQPTTTQGPAPAAPAPAPQGTTPLAPQPPAQAQAPEPAAQDAAREGRR